MDRSFCFVCGKQLDVHRCPDGHQNVDDVIDEKMKRDPMALLGLPPETIAKIDEIKKRLSEVKGEEFAEQLQDERFLMITLIEDGLRSIQENLMWMDQKYSEWSDDASF